MDDGALDDALAALEGFGPELRSGLSNHGPMAAEALVALGRSDDVAAFVSAYRRHLERVSGTEAAVPTAEWEPALGRMERWPEWVARFDRELADRPVSEVVAEWVPRLAPGMVAAAAHGLLRTAHALRSLDPSPDGGPTAPTAPGAGTPVRRHELAEGLAYWAARYQELPGPPLLIGGKGIADALAGLPALPEEAPHEHRISDQLRHLQMVSAPFEQGVAALTPPADLSAALLALAAGGAAAYVANAGRGHEIALVHTVTAPMALDLVLPVLRAEDRPMVFAYGWQAVAAIHAAYAEVRAATGDEREPRDEPLPDGGALAAAAAEGRDEHAIKLTEACCRAYDRTGTPVLLAAAADAVVRLGRP